MIHFKSQCARATGFVGGTISGVMLAGRVAVAASSASCPIAAPPLQLPADSQTSTLTADRASLADHVARAEGHAHLERDGQTLEAPFLAYDRKTSDTKAHGGVRYRRPGLYLTAEQGHVNIDRRTGTFDKARYWVLDSGVRGRAAEVHALGNNRYELTDADYSTCPGPTKAWLLSARRFDLNRRSGRGVAHDAKLKIYGLPVLYTPYISFPIDNRRHSGFLAPTIGVSSHSGFELATPYYLNLAPNVDATLVPHILAQRGFQLGAQLRYLTRHQKGEFDGQYLPQDQKYGADRSLVHFQHIGRLGRYVGIQARFTRVSDNRYFQDLSNDLTTTSRSNLNREFKLTAAARGVDFSILAQDFQTLSGPFTGLGGIYSNHPYRRLPQLNLDLLSPTAPFQAGLDAQFTNFQRSGSVGAYRTDLRPRVLWGVDHGGWYADSQLAYRFTHYDLRNLSAVGSDSYFNPAHRTINRGIPSFKVDAGLRLSRTLANGWTQTLEPKVQYLYVGYDNQSDIPIFDSGTGTLRYDSLFATNRFTGVDRIGDANQVTLGLRSRFISPHSGRTVAAFEFGRITSFRRLRVHMPYAGQIGYGSHGSDYVTGARFAPSNAVQAQAMIEYGSHWSRIDRAAASLELGHRDSFKLDLGYRYDRSYRPSRQIIGRGVGSQTTLLPSQYENLSQTTVGVRAPLGHRLSLVARWNYSLQYHQNVETLAGLEYRPSCCLAARIAWRRYVAGANRGQNNAVLFQFVLRGLGRFGNGISSFVEGNVFSDTSGPRRLDNF